MECRHILVAVPHPDDVELSCGGTVARWAREGHRITLLLATDGARGGKVPGSAAQQVAESRKREQRNAAAVLGVQNVVFLGLGDGELRDDDALRGALVEQVRTLRPDLVMLLDPLTVIFRNAYVNHRDHRNFGIAMLDAMYPEASNVAYFPDQLDRGLQLHKVPEFWLANTAEPNAWVDVSDTLDIRFKALREHRSQMRLWPDGGESVVQQQREAAAVAGLEHGVLYAEEYRRVVVNPLS